MMRDSLIVIFSLIVFVAAGGEGSVVPHANTGTPRALTAEESTKVEAYLKRVYHNTSVSFGEQMGFGPVRMEPLVYFHFLTDHRQEWMQIELLGVVNHAEPVVFKNPLPTAKGADALRNESFEGRKKVTAPQKEQFKKAETRQLLPAEQLALKTLKSGADFYWEQTGSELRAVGALRAATSCAECHEVKEGTLLGALTYRWNTQVVLDSIKAEESAQSKRGARQSK